MKKKELQEVLKPLIKQCIKEVIFEEGVLSGIIKEVAVGIGSQTIVEARQITPQTQIERQPIQDHQLQQEARAEMANKRKRLEEAVGIGSVFEGTQPLSSGGAPSGDSKVSSPLSAYAPNDAGVDISGIMAIGSGQNWKKMI
jgi:hypothetical protein